MRLHPHPCSHPRLHLPPLQVLPDLKDLDAHGMRPHTHTCAHTCAHTRAHTCAHTRPSSGACRSERPGRTRHTASRCAAQSGGRRGHSRQLRHEQGAGVSSWRVERGGSGMSRAQAARRRQASNDIARASGCHVTPDFRCHTYGRLHSLRCLASTPIMLAA
eukprot:224474-Chlamydomonas_euryale.AAC.1